ncbi:MAG: M23 family metallopeptidase, partial [Candidatus Goldbacteria bacterium]|nr:M23 family metallopeptidase [Candidatus Goldiibacteriota bacterium]
MDFKNFILFIFFLFISCKNPYLIDPKFNPKIPKLDFLPVHEADVNWMQPYGYVVYDATRSANHVGFDFGMKSTLAPFYSCGDGVVTEIEYDTGNGLPGNNYRIVIQVSARVYLDYHFEIGGYISEEERKRNIFVKKGDYVKAGQK